MSKSRIGYLISFVNVRDSSNNVASCTQFAHVLPLKVITADEMLASARDQCQGSGGRVAVSQAVAPDGRCHVGV